MKDYSIKLVSLDLKEEDLLFSANFIKKLGGKEKAKQHLLYIIDKYFNSDYINKDL
jgi:hypothetical protein